MNSSKKLFSEFDNIIYSIEDDEIIMCWEHLRFHINYEDWMYVFLILLYSIEKKYNTSRLDNKNIFNKKLSKYLYENLKEKNFKIKLNYNWLILIFDENNYEKWVDYLIEIWNNIKNLDELSNFEMFDVTIFNYE